ncbi:MAG: hypothetical protein IKR57_04785 [Bacilli bacterium]|nr:hypothetical protein [Bacilli bacterium]
MKYLFIIEIILVIVLFVICIETYIFFKKNSNKKVETYKRQLLFRLNIVKVLTLIIAILGIINVIINR